MAHKGGNNQRHHPSKQRNYFYRFSKPIRKLPKNIEKQKTEAESYNMQPINKENTTNRIALYGVIVNAILAVVTFLLFMLNRETNKFSQKSAAAAVTADSLSQKSLEATRKYNDSTFDLQKKAYSQSREDAMTSDKREDKRDIRADSNLKIQNKSMAITQDEFDKINESNLVINRVFNIVFEKGKNISFSYTIACMGNNPIHIYTIGERIKPFLISDSSDYYQKTFREDLPLKKCSFYLAKDEPFSPEFNAPNRYIDTVINAYKKGVIRIDFYGSIYYTSNINKRKRRFDFGIIIRNRPEIGDQFYEFQYGKNYYIEK